MITARSMWLCSARIRRHDVGGDVVRQISHDVDGLSLGWTQIMQRTGTASDHRGELRGDEIRFQHFKFGLGRVLHAKLCRQYAVKLNADHAAAREISRSVSTPRPGPISMTVRLEMSPSASTIFPAAPASIRKFCPSFGFRFGLRLVLGFCAVVLATLTLFHVRS